MKFLKWILALPLIIGAIFFAVANREIVTVNFNPLGATTQTPLYLICFLFLTGGFLLGSIITWLCGSDVRRERRKQNKQIKKLEKEIDSHNEKISETLSKISSGSKYQDVINHDDD